MGLKLAFFEDEIDFPLERFKSFPVKGLKQPRFSYIYRLENRPLEGSSSSTAPISDGLPRKGESVRFYLQVKNVGDGVSKENVAVLKNLSGKEIFLKNGRAELGELKPGATKELTFDFEIRPTFDKNEVEMEVQVYDSQFGEFMTNKLKLNLLAKAPAGPFLAHSAQKGYLKVPADKSVSVYAGASADQSWEIAKLPPNSLVETAGKLGNFSLVLLDSASNSCKFGWVPSSSGLQSIKIEATAKKTLRNILCHMSEPPKITLTNKLPQEQVSTTQFVTLRGKLEDDTQVKDLYINVNKDKVFYQAYSLANKGQQSDNTFEAIVPLQKGVNNVVITARDKDDFFDQYRLVLLYKPEEAKVDRLTLKQ
jgi:carboxyl-terminal processing protease